MYTKRELLAIAKADLELVDLYKTSSSPFARHLMKEYLKHAREALSMYHHKVYTERLNRLVNAFPKSIVFHVE